MSMASNVRFRVTNSVEAFPSIRRHRLANNEQIATTCTVQGDLLARKKVPKSAPLFDAFSAFVNLISYILEFASDLSTYTYVSNLLIVRSSIRKKAARSGLRSFSALPLLSDGKLESPARLGWLHVAVVRVWSLPVWRQKHFAASRWPGPVSAQRSAAATTIH
jgi:hypothetical protein